MPDQKWNVKRPPNVFCASRPLDRLRTIATSGRARHFGSHRHAITPGWSASRKLLVPLLGLRQIAESLIEPEVEFRAVDRRYVHYLLVKYGWATTRKERGFVVFHQTAQRTPGCCCATRNLTGQHFFIAESRIQCAQACRCRMDKIPRGEPPRTKQGQRLEFERQPRA